MNHDIKTIIHKYELSPTRYTLLKSAKIIETKQGTFVLKPKTRQDKKNIYQYLESRSFDYFPKVYNDIEEDPYEIVPYIQEVDMPKEQKAIDLMYLVSLLHNKTTFYKEIDLDDVKALYEEMQEKLNYLEFYYHDLQDMIENNVYMAPSEYLLIRNISQIYAAISFSRQELEHWYKMMSNKKKERFVMLHNNLEMDHFLKNENPYLISWDKAKIDVPIYDFYHFYKKHYSELDFVSLLQVYESKYPLLEEERSLLFVLLSIPDKITLEKDEYEKCKEINRFFLYLEKTSRLISKQNPKNAYEQTN